MKIRTQADIAQLEKRPVAEHVPHRNILDLVQHAGQAYKGRTAIRYLAGTGP